VCCFCCMDDILQLCTVRHSILTAVPVVLRVTSLPSNAPTSPRDELVAAAAAAILVSQIEKIQ